MSFDPFNALPADPEWVKKTDELTKAAAKELGCMVLLLAVQPEGKLSCTIEGAPEAGELAEMAKDPPRMIATLAAALSIYEAGQKHRPRH